MKNKRFYPGIEHNKNSDFCSFINYNDAIISKSHLNRYNNNSTFGVFGLITIDIINYIKNNHQLDSYKLDNVGKHFLNESKDDLKPKEIFEKFRGNGNDCLTIAKYCIQDCMLCAKLIENLKIIENSIQLANVCKTILSNIINRGQTIRVCSLVAYECLHNNYIIQTKKFDDEDDEDSTYDGAFVLEPAVDIYNEPIVVIDFGSLYPSSMIEMNLSP